MNSCSDYLKVSKKKLNKPTTVKMIALPAGKIKSLSKLETALHGCCGIIIPGAQETNPFLLLGTLCVASQQK